MTTTPFNLAANPSSCSEARGHVLDALHDTPDEIRETAALLTSELVTNALVHAASPLTLTVIRDRRLIRVEVSDSGTMPPAVKPYGRESRTGHGLRMVEALAEQWGWTPSASGKVVWFELSKDGISATGATRGMRRPSDSIAVDPYPGGVPITLARAPVQAMVRSGACYDALYRGLRNQARGDVSSGDKGGAGGLFRLLDELSTTFRGFGRAPEEAWERAIDDALPYVDLSFHLPREAGTAVERYGRLLDRAEEHCRQRLPELVPSDEARAVRRWAFDEVISQCRGEPPRPWTAAD